MTPTLQGIRVLDAASFLAGPCAATIMSDYGADVIKIEPLYGDGHRRLSGAYPIDYTWQLTGRNKRSLALDFTKGTGRDVLLRLAEAADVVLFNLRADQLQRYDLSYETLRRRNPRLIYAQISGYGLEGDESARRAFDITGWFARTGILDVMHDKGIAPAPPAGGVGDHATAMTLFGAIMMALYRREQTGEGAMVSTSLAVTGAWANGLTLAGVLAGFDSTERRDEEGWSNPFSNIYGTGDGRHLMLALAVPKQEFPRLAKALGHPEWATDPRFADIRSALKYRHALRELIQFRLRGVDHRPGRCGAQGERHHLQHRGARRRRGHRPAIARQRPRCGDRLDGAGLRQNARIAVPHSRRSAAHAFARAADRGTQP